MSTSEPIAGRAHPTFDALFAEIHKIVEPDLVLTAPKVEEQGQPLHDGTLINLAFAVQVCCVGLARLETAANDLANMRHFSSRYCWDEAKISRSMHLRYCWLLFLNAVYNYREKKKFALGQIQESAKQTATAYKVDVKGELRDIDDQIGRLTRERGQKVHEWDQERREITMLELMEMHPDEERRTKLRDMYSEARTSMVRVMKDVADLAHRDLEATTARHSAFVIELCEKLRARTIKLRDAGLTVSAEELGKGRHSVFGKDSFFDDDFGKRFRTKETAQ